MRSVRFFLQTSFIRLLFFAGPLQAQVQRFPLQLQWTLLSDTLAPVPAVVPGNNFMALQAAGIIPNPFIGDNESRVQWVAERDWVFRSAPFSLPDSLFARGNARMLRFPVISPGATVLLNGRELCTCHSAFAPCEAFDAFNLMNRTDNVLEVRFRSPERHADSLVRRLSQPLPGDAPRAVVRSPQYQSGWDWAPRLRSVGIGAAPEWIEVNDGMLQSASVQTMSLQKIQAKMELRARVWALSAKAKMRLTLLDEEGYVTVQKEFRGKDRDLTVPFTIGYPRLWTTHDRGEAHIYSATLRVEEHMPGGRWHLSDSIRLTFGIRTAELVREKDRIGETFYFRLNGEKIFARGANYVPQDIFPERVRPDQYRHLLLMARDANINMLRVWGGGLYERDLFYHLCDSLGIMVWQDFMFACAMYPSDSEFARRVGEEADFQTRRLSAHPSVVAWCGNNEVSEGWHRWGWQDGLSGREKRAVWKSYRNIFQKTLPRAVKRNTRLAYIETSPQLGRGDKNYTSRGSAHNWWVWHDAAPFENYLEQVPRFMAEFGFQSFPAKATLDSVLAPADYNIYSDAMQAHQKHGRGFELMGLYQDRWNLRPKNFEAGMWLSQIVQAEGIGMGIRAHRTGQPRCSGSLIWQFNDCWPAVSWSMADYYHRPKALYYEVKRSFAPFKIMHRQAGDSLFFYLLNDSPWPEGRSGVFSIMTYDNQGERFREITLPVDNTDMNIQPIASGLMRDFFPKRNPEQCYAVVEAAIGAGEAQRDKDVIFFGHPGLFDLSPSLLKLTAEGNGNEWQIRLETTMPSRFVELKADVPGRWSDNFVDVVPGHPLTVTFTPDANLVNPTFSWNSLYEVMKGLPKGQ